MSPSPKLSYNSLHLPTLIINMESTGNPNNQGAQGHSHSLPLTLWTQIEIENRFEKLQDAMSSLKALMEKLIEQNVE